MRHSVHAAILAAGFVLATGPASAQRVVIEQIIVKVNGEVFTKTDLEARQVAALRQMGQQADPSDAQLRKMLQDLTPQLLVNVVDEMLLVQRGRELGYRLGDEQFQSILESIKKDNKIENDEQFQAALKQENMNLSELRRNLERQMIVSRVQQNEVMGKIAVSEEDARRYYDSHLSEFTTPQAVTLREIFVTVPGDGATVNVGNDRAAQEKAEAIRQRALSGESFEKLAAELSEAPSRANAGLIGPLNLTDLSPDIRKLIEPMKAGELTALLRGNRGYQILKLEERTAAETLPFEKARDDISNRVFTDKRRGEFQKYLERLRSQSIIDWKNPEIEKSYQQGLTEAAAGPSSP